MTARDQQVVGEGSRETIRNQEDTVLAEGVDLVERLGRRTFSRKSEMLGTKVTQTQLDPLCQEAANEITRLREEVEGLRKGLGSSSADSALAVHAASPETEGH